MKALALMSGGKDSFLAAQTALQQGYEIMAALTVVPEEFSMMFHYPNAVKAEQVAGLLDLKWFTTCEKKFLVAVEEFVNRGVEAIISGAIASEYQKTRLERMCTRLGIESYTPLWRKDQKTVMKELLLRGIRAIIVSVSAEGFDERDLGRTIDENYISELENKSQRYGINISGEGGEYESFVTGCRGCGELEITKSRKVWEGSHGYFLIEEMARVSD